MGSTKHIGALEIWSTAFGLLATVLASGVAIASQQALIPPSARIAMLADARRVAAVDGDRHPYDIEAVRTTFKLAVRATCGRGCDSKVLPGGTAVFLLAMRGHFACNTCSHPPGRRFGSGTVIWLLRPVGTMSVTGFGFGSSYPNLSAVGTPVRLDKPPTTRMGKAASGSLILGGLGRAIGASRLLVGLRERVRLTHTRRRGLPRAAAQNPAPGATLPQGGVIHVRVAVP